MISAFLVLPCCVPCRPGDSFTYVPDLLMNEKSKFYPKTESGNGLLAIFHFCVVFSIGHLKKVHNASQSLGSLKLLAMTAAVITTQILKKIRETMKNQIVPKFQVGNQPFRENAELKI